MKCRLVFHDWRQVGTVGSIYLTELGIELSKWDLHSGTVFDAELTLPPDVESEIRLAAEKHGAYPIFAVLVPCRNGSVSNVG